MPQRLTIFSLLILGSLNPWFRGSAQGAPTKKVVAILPFSSPTTYNVMGRNAQETFVTQLVKTRKLRVIQATMVSRMLQRQGLHWTGTIDPALLKAAGAGSRPTTCWPASCAGAATPTSSRPTW